MDSLNSIFDNLKGVLQDKMSELNTEIKNKIGNELGNLNKNVIDQGLSIVEEKVSGIRIIGILLYAVPIILLFYIIYLLNKYH